MQKYFYLLIVSMLLLSGCAPMKGGFSGGKDDGELKASYKPLAIDDGPVSELAVIKAADNLIIVTVDGKRYSNFVKVMVGKGVAAVIVKEGRHTILGFLGVDLNIGSVFYKKGHEYFIDYARRSPKVHYWVEDLTTGEIVYGKKVD